MLTMTLKPPLCKPCGQFMAPGVNIDAQWVAGLPSLNAVLTARKTGNPIHVVWQCPNCRENHPKPVH